MKRCPRCQRELEEDQFNKNKLRNDGLSVYCADCSMKWQREYRKRRTKGYKAAVRRRYLKRREGGHPGAKERYDKWYRENREAALASAKERRDNLNPLVHKARTAVRLAIQRLDLPTADSIVCEHCQEAQGKEYHHHSYEPEFHLDVVALCRACHGLVHRRI